MSDDVIVPDGDSGALSTAKRGIDLDKVNFVMAREQERDLRIIYRIDQLQLYLDDPTDCKKQYNAQRKPSDPPLIQAIWEAHKNYMTAIKEDDQRSALEWFKQQTSLVVKAQDMRKDAMDRMLAWKKQLEANGGGLDSASTEELERLANG